MPDVRLVDRLPGQRAEERSTAPLYVVRDALGHASVATTQIYLSRVGAHEAVEAMRSREWDADSAA